MCYAPDTLYTVQSGDDIGPMSFHACMGSREADNGYFPDKCVTQMTQLGMDALLAAARAAIANEEAERAARAQIKAAAAGGQPTAAEIDFDALFGGDDDEDAAAAGPGGGGAAASAGGGAAAASSSAAKRRRRGDPSADSDN